MYMNDIRVPLSNDGSVTIDLSGRRFSCPGRRSRLSTPFCRVRRSTKYSTPPAVKWASLKPARVTTARLRSLRRFSRSGGRPSPATPLHTNLAKAITRIRHKNIREPQDFHRCSCVVALSAPCQSGSIGIQLGLTEAKGSAARHDPRHWAERRRSSHHMNPQQTNVWARAMIA